MDSGDLQNKWSSVFFFFVFVLFFFLFFFFVFFREIAVKVPD